MAAAGPRNPIIHPFPLIPPILHPPHFHPLLSPPTFFWFIVSTTSLLVTFTSLSSTNSFHSLPKPYSLPLLLLTLATTSRLHSRLFSRLRNPPKITPRKLRLIDLAGTVLRFLPCFYPSEDSLQIVVFFVALAVYALATTKVVRPWRQGRVFHHLMFVAMVRVFRMCLFHGWGFYSCLYAFLYVCLSALRDHAISD